MLGSPVTHEYRCKGCGKSQKVRELTILSGMGHDWNVHIWTQTYATNTILIFVAQIAHWT